jgi:HD-like signal output (HDOD) protein
VALCALLLKIVNSSFFGLARRVTAIESAISYLGTGMLHALMLSSTVTDKLGPRALELDYPLNQKEQQALLCGQLASQLFQDKVQREDAFASGLLHDIGELVLVAEGDADMLDGIRASEQEHRPLHDIELERASVSHAHVGAYLLGAWGLPYTIVEAVAHHHAPTSVEHDQFDIVDAVYVADLLADYSTQSDESLVERAQKHVERFPDSQARLKTLEAAHKQLARASVPTDTTPAASRR